MVNDYLMLKPLFPDLHIMQIVQVVIFVSAAIWIAWRVLSFLGDVLRGSSRWTAHTGNPSGHVPGRRLLVGPMFEDGETRWIRWSK